MSHPTPRLYAAWITLGVSLGLVVLLHLFGSSLFESAWAFGHWSAVSTWYLIAWAVASAALIIACLRYQQALDRFASQPRTVTAAAILLFVLTILVGYDSFVYGGGNLRVAQIAQADPIVHRWWEFGASIVVTFFYKIVSFSDMKDTAAGAMAWRLYAYCATGLSIWASLRLSKMLTDTAHLRPFIFAILFAGPHLLAMMGLIAVEPGLVAAFLWQAVWLHRLTQQYTAARLAALWIVTLIGVMLHWSGVILIPPALLVSLSPRSRLSLSAIAVAVLAFAGMITAIYLRAADDFAFSRFILMLHGRNPMSDYALFSSRHVTDLLQVIAITLPAALLIKLLWWWRPPGLTDRFCRAVTLQATGGMVVLIMTNPRHGMPFDLPLAVVYLAPMALLLATLLGRMGTTGAAARRLVVASGLSSLIMIGSILPVYSDIHVAERYLGPYLKRHNALFMPGSFAFRDAYFHRGELDKANAWEWEVPLQSLAYMHMEGAGRLVETGKHSDGLRSLYQIKTEFPWWVEPRALIATTLMALGRPAQARPEIDTCLMLQPNRQEFHIHRYSALRQQRQHDSALAYIEKALDLWPLEPTIRVDYMYALFHVGRYPEAAAYADSLLAEDSRAAHAHALKGMVSERTGNLADAARSYQEFLRLAPLDPDAETVRRRLDKIKSRL
jgi:hypothetical protein